MTTLRQEVEREMGVSVTHTSKVRAPSAWRKTAKYWFIMGIGFVVGAATAGAIAVLVTVI
jgi:hypothetical protein